MLETYALHGSVSYGEIRAARLREILLGDQPLMSEIASVSQALMEMPSASAFDLAFELGIPYQTLNSRAEILCGQRLPL